MLRCRLYGALGAVLVAFALALPAEAQIQASERGSISQTVDGTVITVDFSRPQLRGRDGPFGTVVHWDEMWTPGANWATTFEFSKDVKLNGHEVPAGTYSVWMQPREEEWTVHLNQAPRLFHTQMPAVEDHFLSFKVTPEQAEPVEVLTFSFPDVRKNGATLELAWGTTAVALDIAVQAAYEIVALTDERVAPYLGEYTLRMYGEEGAPPAVMDVEVLHAEDGSLRGSINGGVFEMTFLPTDHEHTFLPALMQDGEISTVEVVAPAVFDVRAGEAVGFKLTGELGDWMVAERKN